MLRRAVLLLGLVSSVSCGIGVPVAIRDELAAAPRGTTTVVVFSDFQCPFCRKTHAMLASVLAERAGARERLHIVYRHVPLPRHPDARGAARAATCVTILGGEEKGNAYADDLFAAPDLSEAACASLAIERGIDGAAFARCVSDSATDARIDRDIAEYIEVGGDGVPLLYVGKTRIDGAPSRVDLATTLDDVLGR